MLLESNKFKGKTNRQNKEVVLPNTTKEMYAWSGAWDTFDLKRRQVKKNN